MLRTKPLTDLEGAPGQLQKWRTIDDYGETLLSAAVLLPSPQLYRQGWRWQRAWENRRPLPLLLDGPASQRRVWQHTFHYQGDALPVRNLLPTLLRRELRSGEREPVEGFYPEVEAELRGDLPQDQPLHHRLGKSHRHEGKEIAPGFCHAAGPGVL